MSDPQAAMAAAIAQALRKFNTELWTLYTFGVLITLLRTYARVKAVGFRDLRLDDFIVWFAIVSITNSPDSIFSVFKADQRTKFAVDLYRAVDSGIFCRKPRSRFGEQWNDRRPTHSVIPRLYRIQTQVRLWAHAVEYTKHNNKRLLR